MPANGERKMEGMNWITKLKPNAVAEPVFCRIQILRANPVVNEPNADIDCPQSKIEKSFKSLVFVNLYFPLHVGWRDDLYQGN